MGLPASQILEPHQGLRDLGLDSLMAVELRNVLQRGIGHALPATLAFDFPTVEALTARLLDRLAAAEGKPAALLVNSAPVVEPIAANEPIAIVGVGCRLPGGASGPEAFWNRLREGFDAIREIPADRWDIDAYYDPDVNADGKMYTRRGGLPRSRRSVRCRLLRHRAAGSGKPRPAAATAARGELGGAGARGTAAGSPHGHRNGCVRRHQRQRVRSTPGAFRNAPGSLFRDRQFRGRDCGASFVRAGSARSQHGGRYGLFVIARRGAPRRPESAIGRVHDGARCGCQRSAVAGRHSDPAAARRCSHPRASAERSTRQRTDTCVAKGVES